MPRSNPRLPALVCAAATLFASASAQTPPGPGAFSPEPVPAAQDAAGTTAAESAAARRMFDGGAAAPSAIPPPVAAAAGTPAPPPSGKALPPPPPGQATEVLTLSELADRLATDPANLAALAAALRAKAGAAGRGWPDLSALGPQATERLIQAIRQSDKSYLDHFPTMNADQLKAFIAWYGQQQGPAAQEPPYPAAETLSMPGKPLSSDDGAYLTDWGRGLYHGDLSDHGLPTAVGDNRALADALNRLALNEPGAPAGYTLTAGKQDFTDVGEFLQSLADSGHAIVVRDMRMFANFGGLWYQESNRWISVVTPLYADTGLRLPSGRELVVPVSHNHLQLEVRGPVVNAQVDYYLGVGGAAMFHPRATLDKPWVIPRSVEEWTGARALELAERAAITRRELRAKAKKYNLPLGGYGPLGTCADVQAMITGKPIYPQVRDMRYYQDGMTIDAWAGSQPVDSAAAPPDPRRVYDSLPSRDLTDILIPQSRDAIAELKSVVEGAAPAAGTP